MNSLATKGISLEIISPLFPILFVYQTSVKHRKGQENSKEKTVKGKIAKS